MMRCHGIWKTLAPHQCRALLRLLGGWLIREADLPKCSAIVELGAMRQLSQALSIDFFHATAFLPPSQFHARHLKAMWYQELRS